MIDWRRNCTQEAVDIMLSESFAVSCCFERNTALQIIQIITNPGGNIYCHNFIFTKCPDAVIKAVIIFLAKRHGWSFFPNPLRFGTFKCPSYTDSNKYLYQSSFRIRQYLKLPGGPLPV